MTAKKISVWFLVLAMLLVVAGCGSSGQTEANANSNAASGDSNAASDNAANSGNQSQNASSDASSESDYPNKNITLIVPWAAGGGTDLIGRKLAELMEKELGTTIVIINRDGGGGIIGFQDIANSKPDGYTVGIVTNSMILQKYANDNHVDYKSFEPIAVFNYDAASLTVKADARWNTAAEFIEEAKANPGKLSISNSGPGAIWHVAAIAIGAASGAEFKHVPFGGANPAAVAVSGGHVDATTASAAEVSAMVESGDLKILGIAAEERLSLLPDVPTLKEQGIDAAIGVWRGLVAPKGTPADVIAKLEAAVETAVNSQEFVEFMNNGNFGIIYKSSEEFRSFMEEEDAVYAEMFKQIELN